MMAEAESERKIEAIDPVAALRVSLPGTGPLSLVFGSPILVFGPPSLLANSPLFVFSPPSFF